MVNQLKSQAKEISLTDLLSGDYSKCKPTV